MKTIIVVENATSSYFEVNFRHLEKSNVSQGLWTNCTITSMCARYCTPKDYGLRGFVYGLKCRRARTEAEKLSVLI